MTEDLKDRALAAAREVTARLADEGAIAVILTGSWARGDAHRESDLDLRVVGDEQPKRLERHASFLVSTSWQTEDQHREAMEDPEEVGSIVPGWRSAKILHDPDGVAAKLQKEAESWTWQRVDEKEADAYVAKEITKLGEEVHSLYSNLDQENETGAAMQRSLIALEAAPVMAVHHRLLYESEKKLWDLVAEEHGKDWQDAQETALGQNGEPFLDTCVAAFELFRIAAEATKSLFDEAQQDVVAHALKLSPATLSGEDDGG